MIVKLELTPTEVREAAMMACLKFELLRPWRTFYYGGDLKQLFPVTRLDPEDFSARPDLGGDGPATTNKDESL